PSLRDGALFRRRIVNHLPRSPKLVPAWLQAVADAADWGHDDLAVWIARELVRDSRAKLEHLRAISLFAWFSGAPGTAAYAMMMRRWGVSMRFATAAGAPRGGVGRVARRGGPGNVAVANIVSPPGAR